MANSRNTALRLFADKVHFVGCDCFMRISVISFSYKRGLSHPENPRNDSTQNGLGIALQSKTKPPPLPLASSGKPRVKFFEQHKDKVNCFLDAAEVMVRQSIEQYQKDGREHLQVAFGCTGGQHRSVYFAERMAERLVLIDKAEIGPKQVLSTIM